MPSCQTISVLGSSLEVRAEALSFTRPSSLFGPRRLSHHHDHHHRPCLNSRPSLPPKFLVRASRQDERSLSQLEREVPTDQRPVNELGELKNSNLYSWATLDLPDYAKRLFILWGGVFTLIGGPIAYQTFEPLDQPIEFFLSASTGSLLVVAVVSLRIYLGWKYVADRLMTATLEYEETGWYDGQQFVKPPEILTRDRLLGAYEVRPVMARLRRTLQGTGVALLATALALTVAIKGGADSDGVYGRGASRLQPARVTPEGIIFSPRVRSLADLIGDDDLAAAEEAAQGNIPGYCRDRYYKAFAGGEDVCANLEKEERRLAREGS